jgi:pimeloyl-ACP methyl ester carboxylesterase
MHTQIVLLMLSLGAVPVEKGEVVFRPRPMESSVPERFRMGPSLFSFELERVMSSRRYTVSKLRFPSAIETPDIENNLVHAEYFEPLGTGPKRPGVIVLHILGADFPLSRYMAARMADRGVAALFVKLPYYGERRPPGQGTQAQRFLSPDIERTMRSMRQAVYDVRRAGCWLAARPCVDPRRLGVAGISLGGIVAALTAAVDPTINQGAFLLAGGDLSTILWMMPEGAPYRAAWLESGRTLRDLRALTDPFDPLTYADRLIGKRLLFIAGKVDEVIPPASTLQLWEAAGRPPIRWYDCGHYSAVGFLLPGIRQTVDFFALP